MKQGVTPAQVMRLTDWQIVHLYWHKTDEHGGVEIPPVETAGPETPEPPSLEKELWALQRLAEAFRVQPEKIEELRGKLKAKFAAKAAKEATEVEPGQPRQPEGPAGSAPAAAP